jgi:hypothetical protein
LRAQLRFSKISNDYEDFMKRYQIVLLPTFITTLLHGQGFPREGIPPFDGSAIKPVRDFSISKQ